VLVALEEAIIGIPAHRLSAPSIQAAAEAGIVTGIIARLCGLPKSDHQPLLNDALLYLQALESGLTLVSRNISDMDLIEQLVPSGRILFYRQIP
jgi:predicted nucleic acid-binding protein